ncbi:MAG: glycoside hydrolase family 9 protein [Bacteroidales bacterium]|nr:glycoside hydrolase family 9 protein [Bacteroidales bacterium]
MRNALLLLSVVLSLTLPESQAQSLNYNIRVNQAGFLPNTVKYAAIINSTADSFEIKTSTLSATVYKGALTTQKYYASSGENVKIADFSFLQTPGNYVVVVSDLGKSVTFAIKQDVFISVSKAAIKALYYNRASMPLLSAYAGAWARAAGHPDTAVVVHASAASVERPAGTIISTPGGWYDAGDYNKYVVNSGISVFCLLSAYESYPEYFDTLELNIPESGNGIPDILDEALYNVKWMMTMQDTNDGGVYHKTTAASFESQIMPAACTSTRYVAAKGTAAALDFAAIMAMTSRIYKDYLPVLSAQALEQALDAWQWAKNNPNVPFTNPPAMDGYPHIGTGEYGDENFDDEFFWCASELYITTKDNQYYNEIHIDSMTFDVPGWGSVHTLGLMSLITNRNSLTSVADTALAKSKLVELVKDDKSKTINAPYKIPCEFFSWGGNSGFACTGMLLMQAYGLTGDAAYYNAALSALDYLMGKNATQYCFITGTGTKRPMHIHHRISTADAVTEPVPGFLAGGPATTKLDDCGSSSYPSLLPARAYLDQTCSYSTNEVAINWNCPLVYLLGALQSEYLNKFTGGLPEYFSISSNKIIFPFKSGYEYPLTIEGNGNWELEVSEDWIGLSISSGTGNAELNATNISDNDASEDRYGAIYVYLDGYLTDSIQVTQNGKKTSFRIEFEDYRDMSGLQTETTSDAGGGQNLGYVDVGDWATYDLGVSNPGVYLVTIRHAGMAGDFNVYLDTAFLQQVTLPATSDWQDWTSNTVQMPLKAGQYVMKIVFNKIGVNLNWMQYDWYAELKVDQDISTNDISIYPIPADQMLYVKMKGDENISGIQLISMDGKVLINNIIFRKKLEIIDISTIDEGIYILFIQCGDKTYKQKVLIR